MAIRPPRGDSGERESVEFGIAALNARLDDAGVAFPATTDEILAALGETEVPYDAAGHTLDLRDVLHDAETDSFETETELLDALYPAFEARRQGRADTLFNRIRSLLPV
ncbi:hypothetical protein [Halorarum halobium]|uniref:DUF5789 family protein n=1 Tax=Halorarum halobium TaxID=3075121 RepID=UPI0028A75CEF|nr:hypothetical protein [Halobaculum sp. XH14]